ncbi:Protein SMG9 [Aphelenchoides avenae]|nr:Protein SMG9 [Aphelenchus avenae]
MRFLSEERSTASSGVPPDEFKPMSAALRLLDDNLEFSEFTQEYLSDSNTGYHVIGAIGPQGTGKSTLLSMLAGNEPLDLYRQYVFRPCSREAVESCRYQTTKIYAYVTKARTILLDCQALNSAAILDDWLRSQRRHTGPRRVLEGFEAEAAQLLMFLFEVCHTLLFCVDWFIDLNAVRELMRTEVFAELRPEESAGRKRDVNIGIGWL